MTDAYEVGTLNVEQPGMASRSAQLHNRECVQLAAAGTCRVSRICTYHPHPRSWRAGGVFVRSHNPRSPHQVRITFWRRSYAWDMRWNFAVASGWSDLSGCLQLRHTNYYPEIMNNNATRR